MEKIFKHFRSPDGVDKVEGGLENKEKLGELAYVPLFRGNALYNAMFPDVTPLFQAGEEPNAKIILQEILKHKGEQIVMDGTTQNELQKLTAEDIAQILPDAEIKYYQNGNLDVMGSINPAFEKDNTTLSGNLDSKITESQHEQFFSPEDAKEIVSLVKNQIPDVTHIIIALDGMSDHVKCIKSSASEEEQKEWSHTINSEQGKELRTKSDLILEQTGKITFFRSSKFFDDWKETGLSDEQVNEKVADAVERTKQAILFPVLQIAQEIKDSLGIDPEFVVQDVDLSVIDEKTAIIYDRHNALSNKMKLEEKIPQQTILMPLDTGIYHAQQIGALKTADGDYALSKRKLFEKKEQN